MYKNYLCPHQYYTEVEIKKKNIAKMFHIVHSLLLFIHFSLKYTKCSCDSKQRPLVVAFIKQKNPSPQPHLCDA